MSKYNLLWEYIHEGANGYFSKGLEYNGNSREEYRKERELELK